MQNKFENESTTTDYTYYTIGFDERVNGSLPVFMLMVYGNSQSVDYIVQEGIASSGPFKTLTSGTLIAALDSEEITFTADGILYGTIIRIGIKSLSAGTFNVLLSLN